MSFEAAPFRQFNTPWDQDSDKTPKSEVAALPSTLHKTACEKECFPKSQHIDRETIKEEENPTPPLAVQFESSCSSFQRTQPIELETIKEQENSTPHLATQFESSCGGFLRSQPIELETIKEQENSSPPSETPFESSCSSHTLFASQIPRCTLPIRPIASSRHTGKQLHNSNNSVPNPVTYNLVQQIFQTVGELENTLLEDQQNDFNLRMAYELQTEKLKDMCQSLENEKERNVRLMELIRGTDPSSSGDDEDLDNALSRPGATERWSRSSDVYESISPLLMQQRYDELSTSYRQCRKQLIKKEKLLKVSRCETETAKARYDNLLDKYKSALKRIDTLCLKYLQLQGRKNLEIHRLRDALHCASECIVNAQQLIDCLDEETVTLYMNQNVKNLYEDTDNNSGCKTETNETDFITAFKQNLELFVKSLRLCQWVQHVNTNDANNTNNTTNNIITTNNNNSTNRENDSNQ